jgi:hypothetical protein
MFMFSRDIEGFMRLPLLHDSTNNLPEIFDIILHRLRREFLPQILLFGQL